MEEGERRVMNAVERFQAQSVLCNNKTASHYCRGVSHVWTIRELQVEPCCATVFALFSFHRFLFFISEMYEYYITL